MLLDLAREHGYTVVESPDGWRVHDVARSWRPWYLERDQMLKGLADRLRQLGFDPRTMDKR